MFQRIEVGDDVVNITICVEQPGVTKSELLEFYRCALLGLGYGVKGDLEDSGDGDND